MSEAFKFNSGENPKAMKPILFSTILQALDQYIVTEVTSTTSEHTKGVQNEQYQTPEQALNTKFKICDPAASNGVFDNNKESANSKMTEEDYFANYTPSTPTPQHPEDFDSHGA